MYYYNFTDEDGNKNVTLDWKSPLDLSVTEFEGEPQVWLKTPIDLSLTEGEPQVMLKTHIDLSLTEFEGEPQVKVGHTWIYPSLSLKGNPR